MSRPITAVINTLAVGAGNEGTRTMLTRLVTELARYEPDLKTILLCTEENRSLFSGADVTEVRTRTRSVLERIAIDQWVVPRIAARLGDVLVTPTSVGPMRCAVPHVAIVTAHLALPSCQRAAGADGYGLSHRTYYGWPLRASLRRSRVVLGISQFVADGLVRELGIDAARVRAMPLGVEPVSGETPSMVDRDPVVLFVGTLYGYKDAAVAIRAFAEVAGELDRARLVIVGRDPDHQILELRSLAQQLDVDDRVDLLGKVTDDDLEALYRRSSAFVLPSRCEGFGLPALEAMSRGLPVIAARATSLTEVVANAGILVEPGDVPGFAVALRQVLTNRDDAAALAEAGVARAAQMTWRRTASILHSAIVAAGSDETLEGIHPSEGE